MNPPYAAHVKTTNPDKKSYATHSNLLTNS